MQSRGRTNARHSGDTPAADFRLHRIGFGTVGAQRKAWRELRVFVGEEGAPLDQTGGLYLGAGPTDLSAAELLALQTDLRQYVDGLMQGLHVEPRTVALQFVPQRVTAKLVVTHARGSLSDRACAAVALLVAHVGAGRIQGCPHCGRAFLRTYRRRHCHRRDCQQARAAEYWQTYRETPQGRRRIRAKDQSAVRARRLDARRAEATRPCAKKCKTFHHRAESRRRQAQKTFSKSRQTEVDAAPRQA